MLRVDRRVREFQLEIIRSFRTFSEVDRVRASPGTEILSKIPDFFGWTMSSTELATEDEI